MHALEGEHIRLSCYATISVWSLNGSVLPYNVLVSRDQVLKIKFANLHNQGYYECIGRSYNDQFFRSRVFLHVYGNTNFTPLMYVKNISELLNLALSIP